MSNDDIWAEEILKPGLTRIFLGTYYFFTSGTGISDKVAIKFFKDDNSVIVVDRKRRMWRRGKRIKEKKR